MIFELFLTQISICIMVPCSQYFTNFPDEAAASVIIVTLKMGATIISETLEIKSTPALYPQISHIILSRVR
jgi:hypothetical protein